MEISRLVSVCGGGAVWIPPDSSLIWSLWALSGSITGPICESGCVAQPLSLCLQTVSMASAEHGIWSTEVTAGHLNMTEENTILKSPHRGPWGSKGNGLDLTV